MSELLSPAIGLLESAMRFRVARASALASNVANADTPGYRPVDLQFDALLGQSEARLARTHAGHLPRMDAHGANYRSELGPRGARPDGNGVELQREIVKYSRNAGAFSDQAAVLSRLLALSRAAVSGESR